MNFRYIFKKKQKIRIPSKENIKQTNEEDSLSCYYTPFVRYLYLLRFKKVIDYLGKKKYKRILDLGYGCGIFLLELDKHSEELYGCDIHKNVKITEDMLNKEKIKAKLSTRSILNLKYPPNFFDGLVCLSVLEHIERVDQALKNIDKITTKDSNIILGFPMKNKALDFIFNFLLKFVVKSKGKIQDFHVSSDSRIIKEIKKRFIIEDIFRIFFIYVICKCKKK